jgi:Flp pilus assembly protein TadD
MNKKKQQIKKPAKEIKAKKVLFPYFVLPLLAIVLYSNTFHHEYTMDDDMFVAMNKSVQKGLSATPEIFSHNSIYGFNSEEGPQAYRPFTLLSYAFEKSLGFNTPGARHVVNVLLFALTCLLLYHFIYLVSKNSLFSFFSTLLFLVHPIHTEVVASIKSRDEILSLLFMALTLIFVIKYSLKNKLSDILAGCFSFMLCLLSKESGITTVAVIPLTLYFFSNTNGKRIIVQTLPYLVVASVFLLIRNHVLSNYLDTAQKEIINNSLNGAHSLGERYATNFVMLGKYLLLLFIPYPLSYDYSYNQIPLVNWSSPLALISLTVYFGLAVYAVINFKKKDIIAYGIFFYFITLSVTSNLFFLISGSTIAERFLFTPSIGFCLVIIFFIMKISKPKFSEAVRISSPPVIILLVISLIFAILTVNRNPAWKNNYALFTSGVESAPNSTKTHGNLAYQCKVMALKEQNPAQRSEYFNNAVKEFRKACDILPGYEYALYNLGVQYYEMGDEANALKTYQELMKYYPNHINANNNSGVIYFNRKEYDTALVFFQKAASSDPNNSNAIGNIGAIYQNKGDMMHAKEYYERAIAINPNANVYSNLSKVYYTLGDSKKAEFYENKAKEINPQ